MQPALNPHAASTLHPMMATPVSALLWLMVASSSFVFIEPAPCDLLAVVLTAVALASGLRFPMGLGAPALLATLFLVANILSIITASPNSLAPVPYLAFYFALTVYMFVLWGLFAALVAANPGRTLKIVWNGWIIAAVIAVVLGVAAYFHLIPGYEAFLKAGRAKGAFKDPNVYGPFLVPIALWSLATMRGRSWSGILLRAALFLVMVGGLLMGFSRGSWGHFAASLLVLATLEFLTARRLGDYFRLLAAGSTVLVVSVAFVAIALSSPKVADMMVKRASLLQKYDIESGGRFGTQKTAIEHIARDPIGLGPNRTQFEFGRSPHHVYLKVAAENGWLGGLTWLAFVGLSLWRGLWFALKPSPYQTDFAIIYATVVGISAESFIIDSLHWRHYFVLLGLMWGLMLYGQRNGVRRT